jgi:cytochrome b involved in lipid metabolism
MIILMLLLFPFLFVQNTYAYSIEDVSIHNTEDDCWMIFEDSVYDLTEYIDSHDIYMDIRDWCGKDMTEDFITKDGVGRDHKPFSYELLEEYKIGEIGEDEITIQIQNVETEDNIPEESTAIDSEEKKSTSPYNLPVPLFLSIILYWVPYLLIKKGIIKGSIKSFNGFWNTMLLFLLLIPALGFGVVMMIRYKVKSLWNIDFDFMYWHVELSLVMGILALNHFLQRFKIYRAQLKK